MMEFHVLKYYNLYNSTEGKLNTLLVILNSWYSLLILLQFSSVQFTFKGRTSLLFLISHALSYNK